MSGIPVLHSPEQLAEQWGYSERSLRRLARETGSCRILGKVMRFTDEDVAQLKRYLDEGTGGAELRRYVPHVSRPRGGKGNVYFAECRGLVKIGWARSVPRRLKALQTGTPYTIVLVARIRGSQRDELELHKRFASFRERGEWFRLEGELAAYIEALPK